MDYVVTVTAGRPFSPWYAASTIDNAIVTTWHAGIQIQALVQGDVRTFNLFAFLQTVASYYALMLICRSLIFFSLTLGRISICRKPVECFLRCLHRERHAARCESLYRSMLVTQGGKLSD